MKNLSHLLYRIWYMKITAWLIVRTFDEYSQGVAYWSRKIFWNPNITEALQFQTKKDAVNFKVECQLKDCQVEEHTFTYPRWQYYLNKILR